MDIIYKLYKGEITEATHVWNTECGVEAWSEISSVYSNVVDDVIHSIKSGLVNKKLLALMMNPYDVYITKQQEIKNNSLPIGKAKVEIEYKGYLANSIENINESQPEGLKEFIQNRESIQLGIKKECIWSRNGII